jgi:parallel beta-helix repeat protein
MNMQKNFWNFLPALLLLAGTVAAGNTPVTECGTVLTEPGNYKLANELLDCPGDGVAIMGSDIRLDLKGHEISCGDGVSPVAGILVLGNEENAVRNVTVSNGRVSNCNDGVLLIDVEDSKITGITSAGNRFWEDPDGNLLYGTGITVYKSHNNVIMKNSTYGNASDGIGSWASSGNVFKHNRSHHNPNNGFFLEMSTDSLLMCNQSFANTDGILLFPGSNDNLIQGNLVSDNIGGISILGLAWEGWFWRDIPDGNTVRLNIVEGNAWLDLDEIYYDLAFGDLLLHPDGTCQNTWEKNRYGTQYGPTGCIPAAFDLDDVCALGEDED